MRAVYVAAGVSFARIAFAEPPSPDPSGAVDPGAPPLAPLPDPASSAPTSTPAAPWGRTLPLVDLEPYPEALVDRPLTLLPGMTQVSIEYELASTTTETFHNHTPDIAARHAFGPVEVRADLGELATLSALIATDAFPAAILVGAASGAPQSDDSLHEGQFVALEHKVQLAPAQCAAFFAVGASYNENRVAESASMLVWTHVLDADADAELEVQLLPTVALDVGLSVQLPVAMSDEIHATSTVTAASTLMVTVAHSWDLYANGALLDLANYRLPYLAFGFVKRWGG